MTSWTTNWTKWMVGSFVFLASATLVPLINYHALKYYKHRNTAMIRNRYPRLTLLLTTSYCCCIIGSSFAQLSQLSCNQYLSKSSQVTVYDLIGLPLTTFGGYIGLNIFLLKVWLITFNSNHALAKQDALWKHVINSSISIYNEKNGKSTPSTNTKLSNNTSTANNKSNKTYTNGHQTKHKLKDCTRILSVSFLKSKIHNDPLWFVKHKSTLGNYSFMIKIFLIKAFFEAVATQLSALYGYVIV